jgi:phospholipase C
MDQLQKIEHIVVLMLENRSFDHMLGFLSLPESAGGRGRADVDGLTGAADQANEYEGQTYRPEPLHEYFSFPWDPPHHHENVVAQVANNNGGFVEQFAENHHQLYKHLPLEDPGLVMGYHTADHVPAFDELARQFCVCDRWFSALLGPTFPNRHYALAGTSGGLTVDDDLLRHEVEGLKTVFEFLPRGAWASYYHDISSLWLIKRYRHHPLTTGGTHRFRTFRRHARQGKLPAVSWLDPHYAVNTLKGNDDHPPSDIRKGQKLVAEVYNLLVQSPVWDKTLFVITYDEHGGFYDHVIPGPVDDHYEHLAHYGVRVPTIVVSPWVAEKSVSHTVYDHTSVIKTILQRFCRQSDGSIPYMTARVEAATGLGELLTEDKPRACKPIEHALLDEVFRFHDRGEPHEDWKLRQLFGGVHKHLQELRSES